MASAAATASRATTVATTRSKKAPSSMATHTILSSPSKPDAFEMMRPKPNTVLDYHISQTDIQGRRRDSKGVLELHVQQTQAKYEVPPPGYVFPADQKPRVSTPPPEPKMKHSTGKGPCWEFIDDIWRRKVEKAQAHRMEHLLELIQRRKKHDRLVLQGAHARLMSLVGPDWFQELSPNQLRTIDNLKNCIIKDVKSKSTCNTEANMAELGLVLRPNPLHIQTALKKCCKCPVEFLLILYQLMNRRRTNYSLNDRLLLSGVVHLTMRETLKELHIRIPSPPPPPKKPKKTPKRKKKPHYKSPYLIPFTFVPEPRKHTGIYKNNHIQYPESPYFSYLSELKGEVLEEIPKEKDKEETEPKIRITKRQFGITDEQEKELLGELREAQREYNSLVDYTPVPFLRKPTLYIPCDHGMKELAKQSQEEKAKEPETNATLSIEVKVTTDFDESCQPIRKVCECTIILDETQGSKSDSRAVTNENRNDAESDEESQLENQSADLLQIEQNANENSEIVTNQIFSDDQMEDGKAREDSKKLKEQVMEENLIKVGQRESSECKCKEEALKIMEARLCQCDRCKADRAAAAEINAAIEEVVEEATEENEEEVEEEVEEEEEKTEKAPVKKSCDCLEKYLARVRMYEEMKKRFDAQQNLMTLQQQYVIGGVTHTPDGEPVYMLSGVIPHRECPCVRMRMEKEKEEKRLANMPKIPLGRQKYVISGVQETEKGNVYVVSGAVATEDCACMKIYKMYEKRHMPCLQAYQEYLRKIEIDKQEYMKELSSDGRLDDIKEQIDEPPNVEEEEEEGTEKNGEEEFILAEDVKAASGISIDSVTKEMIGKIEENIPSAQETQKEQMSRENNNEDYKKDDAEYQTCKCGVINGNQDDSDDLNDITVDTELNLTLEVNKKRKKKKDEEDTQEKCICEPDYTVSISKTLNINKCQCDQVEDSSSSETEPESEYHMKRFVIVKKIPCKLSQQLEILKRALNGLADDGFPLAKLPDCYKLPHFKLWMQMRCGKFWTQEDRQPLLMKSFSHWRHYDYCVKKIKIPTLNISFKQASKYTWAHAKVVRKMAMEKDDCYYREVRRANIGDGREFFPSTFSYELPTPKFRDCYFAYTAAKEEECICWRPWYSHEVKNMSARKMC